MAHQTLTVEIPFWVEEHWSIVWLTQYCSVSENYSNDHWFNGSECHYKAQNPLNFLFTFSCIKWEGSLQNGFNTNVSKTWKNQLFKMIQMLNDSMQFSGPDRICTIFIHIFCIKQSHQDWLIDCFFYQNDWFCSNNL